MVEELNALYEKLFDLYIKWDSATAVSDWGDGSNQGLAAGYLDSAARLKAILVRVQINAKT